MPHAARAPRAARLGPKATPLVARVYAALADGRFHSGEALARALGVSRSAVWKAAAALRAQGSALHAVPNRGYRLAHGSEPLDGAKLREHLAREVRERIASIDTAWAIDSTNTALLARANPDSGTAEVLLAEYQSAGRGRRGRAWLAPPGGAICLSMSWTFREVPQDLGALGLVIGVCALRALREQGVGAVSLKWPNDLLVGERKLGGVLIDLAKGWIATGVVAAWVMPAGVMAAAAELAPWRAPVCGIAVMLGHVYPLWYGFRGGKGVATLLGAVLGINAWLLLPMILTWLAAVIVFGYVGLASILGAISLPVAVALTRSGTPLLTFGILSTLLILYTHRSNLARMRAGTESRARRLWLFGTRRGHA